MKIISETELPGSEVVEVVARALYAHNNHPGADPMTVPWPPAWRPQLMKYWNAACAVVRAQRAFVARRGTDRSECLGPSSLAAGTTVAGVTRDDHGGNLAPDIPQAAEAGCELSKEIDDQLEQYLLHGEASPEERRIAAELRKLVTR